MPGIREQREGEVVLAGELLVTPRVVRRHAEHHRPGPLQGRVFVAEVAGLPRATRGVVLRVEVEDDALAEEPRERDGVAMLVGELEVRGAFACLRNRHGLSVNPFPNSFKCEVAFPHPNVLRRVLRAPRGHARTRPRGGGVTPAGPACRGTPPVP